MAIKVLIGTPSAGAGSGDMTKAVYDPQNINGDAFDRSNHTGTQTSSTISDFDTSVSNNSDVSANTTHRSQTNNPHSVTKSQVGLSNVDNTSDVNKPVSTATQTELDKKVNSIVTSEPTGSDKVINVVSLTQAEYDAGTPVSTTFYVITDA